MTSIATACLTVLLMASPQVTVSTPIQPPQARDSSSQPKGTASIKGKVVAADGGRAVRRVQISLSSPELQGEPRSMSTNAEGIFEFTELPAGRYTLTANRGGYLRLQYGQRRPGEPGRPIELGDGQKVANADFALPRASAMVGRITDEIGDPLPNVSVYPAQWRYFRGQRRMVPVPGGGPFNRTDDTGAFRVTNLEPGDYYVLATTREAWTDEKNPKERIGFLPTYSGGTPSPGEALRITVGLGQEALVPEFAMVPGRVGTISGTAVSSSGLPLAGEQIEMSQEFSGPGTSSMFGAPGTKVAADGTFTIRNVSPGEYKISLRSAGDSERPAEGVTTTILFNGDDLTGVQLVTTTGGSLRGRVITDTGEPLPRDLKMRVNTRPLDPARTYSRFDQDNGRVRDDMTFEVSNVFGLNRVNLIPVPTGWALRSVDFEGKDLADTPIEVRGGQKLDGITIVLSKTLPGLRGTLLTSNGQPAEGTVVIFPEDTSRWSEESRLVRSTRPDFGGTFEFRNLVPGDYLVAAVEYMREGDWADPTVLERLREQATRVRVHEGAAAPPVSLTLKK